MLELEDFVHLPQVEPLFDRLVTGGPGLIVVVGWDPSPVIGAVPPGGYLPSGRATIFRILARRILEAHPAARACIVAGSKEAVRVPRSLRHRVELRLVPPSGTYSETLLSAASERPDLLVLDSLSPDTASAALAAARSGLKVLTQLDTVFRGAGVARQLFGMGVPRELLNGLSWIVTVQRLETLCPHCKAPGPRDPAQLAELHRRFPGLVNAAEAETFFSAPGCRHCRDIGREGAVTAFDICQLDAEIASPLYQPSQLPLEAYMFGLACRGVLSPDDLLNLEADHLRRTYNLLVANQHTLTETNAELERKQAELEAANRVLQQRTEALVSLESIGRALATSTGLDELAARLCRGARDLCGADRSILYYRRQETGTAEVLAACGWDPAVLHQPLEAEMVFDDKPDAGPDTFDQWPPGVPHRPTDVTATALRTGMCVPLVVQEKSVGLMIVHTSQKARFAPGEVALLQTFANQAAVAIQRAGLVEALQEKIAQLTAAQAELVKKERLERELELARHVQQSVLPSVFPLLPGYTFAARSEPARSVGGDFYDVIPLGGARLGIVIGDVSDKGMPAALYMAQTHSLLRAEARRQASPRAVLITVHHLLQELGRSGMFVTVFYGIVDGPSRRFTYARAGHNHPLLLRGGEVISLTGEGTVIGFPDMDDLHLTEEKLDLARGDRLVFYTDGLIDTVGPDGQHFGLDRLKALLHTSAADTPAELCSAIVACQTAYQGTAPQYDDMTLLTMGVE